MLFALAALATLLLAASAQAVTYTQNFGQTLFTGGKLATSVAVNQSSRDVYVSSAGVTEPGSGEQGGLQRFSSAGAELSCALTPAPAYPAGLAINPNDGRVHVFNQVLTPPTAGELRTYPAGCGPELGVNAGTADMTSGSTSLTNVSTAHPLKVNQGITGPVPGIPSAAATGDVEGGSKLVKNISGVSGTLAVGQRVIGAGFSSNAKIAAILSPTEVELTVAAIETVTGTVLTVRTFVTKVEGSTVTLSNAAEATGSGVSIEGTAWRWPNTNAQPAADDSGNLYLDREAVSLRKVASWGEELVEGAFPNTTSANKVNSVALDAQGNLYVASVGSSTNLGASCASTTDFKLKKLQPNGEDFAEGGPIGPESVFAGLSADATTVAVDKSTGNVYVGRSCGTTFKVAVYGPGGGGVSHTPMAEFGEGSFAASGPGAGQMFNQLAVDETSGTVYAADASGTAVQVFENTSASKTLSTSASPSGQGSVVCNGTGNACLASYDEGQEVIAEAEPEPGFQLKEWANGTGSATSCNGTTGPCTFTLSADSSIEAVFESAGPTQPLSLSSTGSGTGTFTCKVLPGGSEGPCAAEYEEGKEVEVINTPDSGSHFVGWSGDCTGSGSCVVTMSAPKSVSAQNDLDEETFAVNQTGNGTVSCEDNASPASCSGPFLNGHTIKVSATPEAGWELTSLTGTGSASGTCSSTTASGSCEFTIAEASEVSASFAEEPEGPNPSTLYVFKGGNGAGTVTSDPAGISCGAEPCEAAYEEGETIELTASPDTGTVVAGWIGCRPVAGEINKCNVTLKGEEVEVTAIFLVEGIQGEDGATGPTGNSGTPGDDGATGATGPQGPQGPAGQDGSDGSNGTNGTDGKNGANGAPGPQGPQGPQGPEGPQGPTGKVKVTCKVNQNGAQVKVTCKVQQAQSRKKKRPALRWRLMQGGHAQSHGTSKGSLRLNLSNLKPGRYVLNVNGQATRIVVPAHHSSNG